MIRFDAVLEHKRTIISTSSSSSEESEKKSNTANILIPHKYLATYKTKPATVPTAVAFLQQLFKMNESNVAIVKYFEPSERVI